MGSIIAEIKRTFKAKSFYIKHRYFINYTTDGIALFFVFR